MTATTATAIQEQLHRFREDFGRLQQEIGRAIVGSDELVTDCLTAICAGGHVLLEGVPGLGKTSLVKAISAALDLDSGRIQCTPDLMPADILGTHVVNEDESGRRRFIFDPGPVFHHVLLVDEINRATPKTQSALLEVMQEGRVSAGRETHRLPQPFFLMATQNPLEMEGTYPLPEAQLDRFIFKLLVTFPQLETLVTIAKQFTGYEQDHPDAIWDGGHLRAAQEMLTRLPIAEPVTAYAARLVLATHPDQDGAPESVKRFVAYGSSPRGLQALIRAARVRCALREGTSVSVADVRSVVKPSLRHRMIRNFEGEAEATDIDQVIGEIVAKVPAPGSED